MPRPAWASFSVSSLPVAPLTSHLFLLLGRTSLPKTNKELWNPLLHPPRSHALALNDVACLQLPLWKTRGSLQEGAGDAGGAQGWRAGARGSFALQHVSSTTHRTTLRLISSRKKLP